MLQLMNKNITEILQIIIIGDIRSSTKEYYSKLIEAISIVIEHNLEHTVFANVFT